MKVLIFDTETTGLPKYRDIPVKKMPGNWPHIVSISWILLEDNVEVSRKSYIIKPRGWEVPVESTQIHGISNEKAVSEGHDLEEVINEFICERYDLLVAHNLEFDDNVLVNAIYWDLGRKTFRAFPDPKKCSMKLGTDICKIPSQYGKGYKPPKLSEFYNYVFKRPPIMANLHSSLYDVEVLVDIIQGCRPLQEKLGLVNPSIINSNDHQKISRIISL